VDPARAVQEQKVMAKGFEATISLTTDDCRAAYEELEGRGIEFVEQPGESLNGFGSSFCDPSGNQIRLTPEAEDGGSMKHRRRFRRARH
jgi:hypothetical protein